MPPFSQFLSAEVFVPPPFGGLVSHITNLGYYCFFSPFEVSKL